MVTPAAGTVVLVPFPFSDLSQAKLRPAHHSLMVSAVGTLNAESLRQIIKAVVVILYTSLRP